VNKSKLFKIIPGPLVAVVFGILYQVFSSKFFPEMGIKGEHLVSVPTSSNMGEFLSNFTTPDFTQITNPNVWITGVTIAVVASLETLLCVDATDKLDPDKGTTNTNRELLAQGTGNMLSGLIGGLPITQVIVRSSANIQSGGKSKIAAILHGVFILTCVGLIPFVLNLIPLAVLASILFIVGFKLAKPSLFRSMYKLGWQRFVPFLVTILGVVFIDLLKGISLGMLVAIITIIPAKLSAAFSIIDETQGGMKKLKMVFAEKITFFNKRSVYNLLEEIEHGTELIIDMKDSSYIDSDVSEMIDEFMEKAEERDIKVSLLK
jgi:MFS superfamily sulfate permease-like transporter